MKIMVVDDEYYAREALVNVIERSLSGQTDTFIQAFDSAQKAIEAMPGFVPDILFTDIRMDEMTGLELCEFVHHNFSSVTLVIISGYADFGYAQKAIRFNVSRYLTKPVSESDIQEILQQFVFKSRTNPSGSFHPNDIPAPDSSSTPVSSDEITNIINVSSCRLIRHYMTERNLFSLMEILRESFDIFLADYGCGKAMSKKYFSSIFGLLQSHETKLEQNEEFAFFKKDVLEKSNQISDTASAYELMNEVLRYLEVALTDNIKQEASLAEKIIAYIENHYFEDLNMNDIAKNVFFISPNYLSKLVNDATGLRFSKYLLKIRMENARKILAREDLSISEVAQLTGYNSESHFIQLFKKYYGKTPKHYRSALLK